MAVTVLDGPAEVRAAVGTHLGHSEWLEIADERLDRFADATGAEGVHPYLVLALSNLFLPQIVEVRGFSSGVNYGLEGARFGAPVAAGSRIRAGADLVAAADVGTAVQTLIRITIEVDGSDEPACVIDSLSRWLP
jgi:acyl dehydratase